MLRDDIKPLIPRIKTRDLTNREVAALLGYSEYTVCRVLKQLKVVRDPVMKPDRSAERELEKSRHEFRAAVAKTMGVKEAAAAAHCSIRTIYRWKNKS